MQHYQFLKQIKEHFISVKMEISLFACALKLRDAG